MYCIGLNSPKKVNYVNLFKNNNVIRPNFEKIQKIKQDFWENSDYYNRKMGEFSQL